jgi:hypothetical protein
MPGRPSRRYNRPRVRLFRRDAVRWDVGPRPSRSPRAVAHRRHQGEEPEFSLTLEARCCRLALELALFWPDKLFCLGIPSCTIVWQPVEIINADGRKLTLPQVDQRSEVRNGSIALSALPGYVRYAPIATSWRLPTPVKRCLTSSSIALRLTDESAANSPGKSR